MQQASADASITPPFGYGAIAPLQKADRVRLHSGGAAPAFCGRINAVAISAGEFARASRDYPLVFSSPDGGISFGPVAVLGLAEGRNLFLDASGKWDAGCYLPAYVRRHPFCMSGIRVNGKAREERLVCIETAHLDAGGTPLFDAAGSPSAQWQAIERLLRGFEDDLETTSQMCAVLAKLGLFSPFRFEVTQDDKPQLTLQGMYRIDEGRLADLRPASLKALVTQGLMAHIYAHFRSLDRFGDLYSRAAAQAGRSAPR